MFPIYLINLDRSPERLASMQVDFAKHNLSFQRIPAVDAKLLADDYAGTGYQHAKNRSSYFAALKPGEVACLLSHRLACKTFLEQSDAPCALFMEDDLRFLYPPGDLFDAFLSFDWQEFDVVKLYSKRNYLARKIKPLNREASLYRCVIPPVGTQSQLISRAGAQKILDATDEFWKPIDVIIQEWWKAGLRLHLIRPNVVEECSEELGGSVISSRKRPLGEKLTQEIRRPLFRLKLNFLSIMHYLQS